jgi:LSD1 subclass zinc finger protein
MSQSETRSPRPPVYSHQRCVNNSNTVRDSPQTNGSFQIVQSGGKARLQCHACNRLLEYDAGAQYVQVCSSN